MVEYHKKKKNINHTEHIKLIERKKVNKKMVLTIREKYKLEDLFFDY